MEPVVERFYAQLKEGKIVGHQCSKCRAVQFPPMGLCPACGSRDYTWMPMSGKARLMFASVGPHRMWGIEFLQGTVMLDEGPWISGMLLDDSFDLSKPEKILGYIGADIPVRLTIIKNPEGVEAIAFKIEK
jgi:uncharacterized OB-fold protein